MRKKIVAGNWKMNMGLDEGLKFAGEINAYFRKKTSMAADVIICSPFIHLAGLTEILKTGPVLHGAQNCAAELSGAFTGEVSAPMVKSTGAKYVIIGHSERRIYYQEDDRLLNKKSILALNSGLRIIFCCGEVLEERESGRHFEVVQRQIEEGLLTIPEEDFSNVVIAYEPVWAIGTGLTASPDQAQEMHEYIRSIIRTKHGNESADNTSILYGGSCKPSNASDIFSRPDVDGGLIGGASLNLEDFCAIVEAI
jgi:triosephosphate isomerase